jgi:hypothetical protein
MLSREELELQDVQRQMEEQLVEQFMQVRCVQGAAAACLLFICRAKGVWGRGSKGSWWRSSCA